MCTFQYHKWWMISGCPLATTTIYYLSIYIVPKKYLLYPLPHCRVLSPPSLLLLSVCKCYCSREKHTQKNRMWNSGVTAIMVAIEFFEVGLTTLSKAAMRRGMSNFVFVVYSNTLAIFFLLSSSLIFYRFTYYIFILFVQIHQF